jgi:hypothetical protein
MGLFPSRNRMRRSQKRSSTPQYIQLERRQLLACIEVSGHVTEDTVWDSPDGYCLIGDVTVDEGVTLEVTSDLEFESQTEHVLTVDGNLSFDQMESGDLQIVVSSTGSFTVSNSSLGCDDCETPNFTLKVDGDFEIVESNWELFQLTINEGGLAAATSTEITTNLSIVVNGAFNSDGSTFNFGTFELLGQGAGFFTNDSHIFFDSTNVLDESLLTIEDDSSFESRIHVTSEMIFRDSWLRLDNDLTSENANLTFENSRMRGVMDVAGGDANFHKNYFENYEVDLSFETVTSLTENDFGSGTIIARTDSSRMIWDGNVFFESSRYKANVVVNPENVETVLANSIRPLEIRFIFITGVVTRDVTLTPYSDDVYDHIYFVFDYLTIQDGATLTLAEGTRVLEGHRDRSRVDVYGTLEIYGPEIYGVEFEANLGLFVHEGGVLNANRASLQSAEFRVFDGGEIELVDSGVNADLFLDAKSFSRIDKSRFLRDAVIHSDAQLELGTNFIDVGATFEVVGDPSSTVDLTGQYWNSGEDQIPELITDQEDDPSLPKVLYQPVAIDSPYNGEPILGTQGDDTFTMRAKLGILNGFFVSINGGEEFQISVSNRNRFVFDGLGGNDKVTLLLEENDEHTTTIDLTNEITRVTHTRIESYITRRIDLIGFEEVEIDVHEDMQSRVTALFNDSELDDEFLVTPLEASLSNDRYTQTVRGMNGVVAMAENGGEDNATIRSTNVDESFIFQNGKLRSVDGEATREVSGFELMNAIAPEGAVAEIELWGTNEEDRTRIGRGWASIQTQESLVQGFNFSRVAAHGVGMNDTAFVLDSVLDDTLYSRPGRTFLTNDGGRFVSLFGYQSTTVKSEFGNDQATILGSTGDDELFGNSDLTQLKVDDTSVIAMGFSNVAAYSRGGVDSAYFNDSPNSDTFVGSENYTSITDGSYRVAALNFQNVTAKSTDGLDVAHLSDSSGDDIFFATPTLARISHSGGTERTALSFTNVFVTSTNGTDRAFFRDSAGDDVFVAKPESALMSGVGYQNFAVGFESASATSTGGDDIARFVDSVGDDNLFANAEGTRLKGEGFNNFTTGFRRNLVFSRGGNDSAFLIDTVSNDYLGATGNDLWMFNDDYYRFISGFEKVEAAAINGGVNRTKLTDVLFELELFGDWV